MSTGTEPGAGKAPQAAPEPAGAAATHESADSFERRVGELEGQLAETRGSLTQSQRRHEVYRLLTESGATDAEASSALIMEKIGAVAKPDIADEVRALKRRKPGLFKRSSATSSMGGRESDPPTSPIETAARDAKTGGRAALLRYMRARRA